MTILSAFLLVSAIFLLVLGIATASDSWIFLSITTSAASSTTLYLGVIRRRTSGD